MACVRVSGSHAYEAVDQVCTAELFLRDTQMRSTLLLDDHAHVLADIYVCRDDDDFIILSEGLDAPALIEYVRDSTTAALQYDVRDIVEGRQIISLNGPYAWEVLATMIGAEVIGLPYLSMLRLDRGICFRAGKTGEYGYDLLLDDDTATVLLDRVRGLADDYDMVEAVLPALDQCALENWFFNIRREGAHPVTPLELQLQWRTSRRKQYRGAEALAERRRAGIERRLTTLAAPSEVAVGDTLHLDDREIGVVANAGISRVRGDHVAIAFVDVPYASSGIARYTVLHEGVAVPVRTVSPPVINNRSLHVSPQLHSYATRADFDFPDLIPHHAAPG